jgi:predicted MFS family arabinose efflux permease
VLGVLFVVYVFNFADRQVLSILIPSIKAEFAISDTLIGLLTGPAFAFFYTVMGVPIARWADRGSRRAVLITALSVWSLMTAASGLARSYWTLTLARIGVGVGEAGGTPPSHSLLSDYFPPERRATALALYGNGVYIGSGLGITVGGLLEGALGGWRNVFFAVGLAGLPLALLVWWTVRDLPRGFSDRASGLPDPVPDGAERFTDVMRQLFAKAPFTWLVFGASFKSMAGYAVLVWGGVFLIRVHGMSGAEVGALFGPTIMISGCFGVSFGGWLTDRIAARDARWYMRLPAIYSVLAWPLALGFVLSPGRDAAIAFFVPFYAITNMYVGPLWSTAQNLARPDQRATASAVLLFILNLTGLGLGPFLIGAANDLLAGIYGDLAVRYSLLGVLTLSMAACVPFWIGSRTLPEALATR